MKKRQKRKNLGPAAKACRPVRFVTIHPWEHEISEALDLVGEMRAKREKLRQKPATNEQLACIWPLWNALPEEMVPDEKAQILCGGLNQQHWIHLSALHRRFPSSPFPLSAKTGGPGRQYELDEESRAEYHQALIKIRRWAILVDYARSTLKHHQAEIKAQLDYSTFDNVVTGRTAIYRTVKELELTHPALLNCPAPTLADIEHLQERYSAYLQAREDAVSLLSPLVFLPSLVAPKDLDLDKQAFGLPHPPPRFPRHLYIARLARFQKCSPRGLAKFMTEDFFKLSLQEQLEFCREYHRPTIGRGYYYYGFLWVWLADNAPVFNAFRARWPDILVATQSLFNSHAPQDYRACPKDEDHLKALWNEFEKKHWPNQPRRITPPLGRCRVGVGCVIPKSLLTPLPFVSAASKR